MNAETISLRLDAYYAKLGDLRSSVAHRVFESPDLLADSNVFSYKSEKVFSRRVVWLDEKERIRSAFAASRERLEKKLSGDCSCGCDDCG